MQYNRSQGKWFSNPKTFREFIKNSEKKVILVRLTIHLNPSLKWAGMIFLVGQCRKIKIVIKDPK